VDPLQKAPGNSSLGLMRLVCHAEPGRVWAVRCGGVLRLVQGTADCSRAGQLRGALGVLLLVVKAAQGLVITS
jgi:hypothetical protein